MKRTEHDTPNSNSRSEVGGDSSSDSSNSSDESTSCYEGPHVSVTIDEAEQIDAIVTLESQADHITYTPLAFSFWSDGYGEESQLRVDYTCSEAYPGQESFLFIDFKQLNAYLSKNHKMKLLLTKVTDS